MSDADLRRLEREAVAGGVAARQAFARALAQRGEVERALAALRPVAADPAARADLLGLAGQLEPSLCGEPQVVWRREQVVPRDTHPQGRYSPPHFVVAHPLAVVVSSGWSWQGMVALDPDSGETLWETSADAVGVSGDAVLVYLDRAHVQALDLRTGAVRGELELPISASFLVHAAEDLVLVKRAEHLQAYTLRDPTGPLEPRWEQLLESPLAPWQVGHDAVWVIAERERLVAFDRSTGARRGVAETCWNSALVTPPGCPVGCFVRGLTEDPRVPRRTEDAAPGEPDGGGLLAVDAQARPVWFRPGELFPEAVAGDALLASFDDPSLDGDERWYSSPERLVVLDAASGLTRAVTEVTRGAQRATADGFYVYDGPHAADDDAQDDTRPQGRALWGLRTDGQVAWRLPAEEAVDAAVCDLMPLGATLFACTERGSVVAFRRPPGR